MRNNIKKINSPLRQSHQRLSHQQLSTKGPSESQERKKRGVTQTQDNFEPRLPEAHDNIDNIERANKSQDRTNEQMSRQTRVTPPTTGPSALT